jgi:hypothetical protein
MRCADLTCRWMNGAFPSFRREPKDAIVMLDEWDNSEGAEISQFGFHGRLSIER